MRTIVLFCFTFCSILSAITQELNCQVSIITNAKLEITSVEREVLDQLENTIYELMNNTQWTDDKFEIEVNVCSRV